MHHKRKRHPAARAGCAMCKPHKKGWSNPDTEVVHYGFGKIRDLKHAKQDMKEY
jgi:hypothetical protein